MSLIDQMAGQPLLLAVLISLAANILVSILGFLPSTFVTTANIVYFGFSTGLIVSIAGEALGAIITFILYRKGVENLSQKVSKHHTPKLLARLEKTDGREAFFLVVALRIFPFAPSGLVTLAAALSKMGVPSFAISSTIGKVPALLIEAYSVKEILGWEKEYQFAAAIFVLILVLRYYWTTKKKKRRTFNLK